MILSRETVRKIRRETGILPKGKRKTQKHRKRRERYVQEGILLQMDARWHDWLEGRRSWMSLVGVVNSVTGNVLHA